MANNDLLLNMRHSKDLYFITEGILPRLAPIWLRDRLVIQSLPTPLIEARRGGQTPNVIERTQRTVLLTSS